MTIQVRGLSVKGPEGSLLAPLDFALQPGHALVLLGESGSGKSLLAQTLMGTLPKALVADGEMQVDGQIYPLHDMQNRRHLWGRQLVMLPQEPMLALDPTMRVLPQVAEGMRHSSKVPAALQLLDNFAVAHTAKYYPHMLSGGMAQRVAFAASLAAGGACLIADEPTKGLDAAARDEVLSCFRRHLAAGGYLLVITHDLQVAKALSGELMVFHQGSLCEQGDTTAVIATPKAAFTRQLIAADPENWPATSLPDRGALQLEAKSVSHRYGERRLFAPLDLRLHQRERLAICAPSGVGKTTLGNLLIGMERPAEGEVIHYLRTAVGQVQKLYQDPALAFPPLVTLKLAMRDVAKRFGVAWQSVIQQMESLGLSPRLLDRLPGAVSGGELQRLSIIRALLTQPQILFADEPTSRLDLLTQQQTMQQLLQQITAKGASLLLVTHDQVLASRVTHRQIHLRDMTAA
ncbi:ATP-binding cassette domain-containing protein [Leeia sp. TBRC 13508]|uniref:ATP-binding cassette domain-containing protein n=1 Tax=Leeia speluncae TaxID=2884804 RepID=A0ABS8D3H4_9NEIS|nr:ATP-binding cassette domain-containing protein [Leeia speluncae]MCB6182720.1 ATP-binding cassette domain-containing protein [Leeia speluncae]